MIVLHKLSSERTEFQLNPDMILSLEANPDCIITLTTGAKVLVCEAPDEVRAAVREWRVEILSEALARRPTGR